MNEKSIDSSADVALILILPIALLIMFLFATWPVWLAGIVLNISFNFWKRYQWQNLCQKVNPVFHQLIKENRGSITALDLAMKTNFSATTAKRYLETKAAEFGAQYQDYDDRDRVYYFMTASTLGKILDDSEPVISVQPHVQVVPLLSENENQLLQLEALHQPTPTEIQAPFTAIANATLAAGEPEPAAYIQSVSDLRQFKDEQEEIRPPSAQNQLLLQENANPTSIEKQPDIVVENPSQQAELAHIQSEPKLLLQAELAKRFDVHSSTVYKRRDEPDFAEWSRSKDPEGIAWQYLPDTKQFCPLETQLQ
ncbi:MAG: hypothetical protein KME05_19275 [Gloeocapsa sp. UFS-A4-WI-NPMV-4B04]|jgi:hypothetical protein|nr:hypothetical protein [Gloeocapsa sp. UFS-A4-WI-NPMV-4B04]